MVMDHLPHATLESRGYTIERPGLTRGTYGSEYGQQ